MFRTAYNTTLWRVDGSGLNALWTGATASIIHIVEYGGSLLVVTGTESSVIKRIVNGTPDVFWQSPAFADGGGQVRKLVELDGALFVFTAGGIWRTTGDAPTRIPNLRATDVEFVAAGGRLHFRATDAAPGNPGEAELWSIDKDGSTARVGDIWPGSGSSNPRALAAAGDRLYFLATSPDLGEAIWVSEAGAPPVLALDLAGGSTDAGLWNLTASGDMLFFTGTDGANGIELWRLYTGD